MPRLVVQLAMVFGLLLACFVAALVAGVQGMECEEETSALGRRAATLRSMVRNLEVTETRAEEFAQDRRARDEKLAALHRMTPAEPALDEFVAHLAALADECGVELLEWAGNPPLRRGPLDEVVVTVRLRGGREPVAALARRSARLARLHVWRDVTVRGGESQARISVYYAPSKPGPTQPDWCDPGPSDVWLWPYTRRRDAARAEIARVCGELGRHAATMAAVADFEAKGERLASVITAIEKVRTED